MSKKISVIIKEPGRAPRHVNISDSDVNLEKTVGGEIDELLLASDLVVLRNRNQNDLPECYELCGVKFNGMIVFCGIGHKTENDADELTDIPVSFKQFKELFQNLWK